jgi:hypothetical protein
MSKRLSSAHGPTRSDLGSSANPERVLLKQVRNASKIVSQGAPVCSNLGRKLAMELDDITLAPARAVPCRNAPLSSEVPQ